MSSFVPGNIRTAVIANVDILHNRIVVDGLVLRIVVDGLVLRVVMDGLGLGSFAAASPAWASSVVGPETSFMSPRATELVSLSSSVVPAASPCMDAAELPSSLFPMGMACGQARARIAASRTAAVAIAFLFDFACVMIAATSRLFPHGSVPLSRLLSIDEHHRPLGGHVELVFAGMVRGEP